VIVFDCNYFKVKLGLVNSFHCLKNQCAPHQHNHGRSRELPICFWKCSRLPPLNWSNSTDVFFRIRLEKKRRVNLCHFHITDDPLLPSIFFHLLLFVLKVQIPAVADCRLSLDSIQVPATAQARCRRSTQTEQPITERNADSGINC
jgi:hypothetical protein